VKKRFFLLLLLLLLLFWYMIIILVLYYYCLKLMEINWKKREVVSFKDGNEIEHFWE